MLNSPGSGGASVGSAGYIEDDDLDDLRNDLVEALNNAKTAGKQSDKLQNLSDAREIVLHRDSSKELLREFAEDFVGFRLEKKAPVRMFVIKFVEDACAAVDFKDPQVLPQLFDALVYLVNDKNSKNQIKVWVTAMNLFRPALSLLCDPGFFQDDDNAAAAKSLNDNLQALRESAMKEFQDPKSKVLPITDMVKIMTLSFLRWDEEASRIAKEDRYKPKEERLDTGPDAFTLDMVPRDHPVLSIVALEKAGGEMASAMCTQILDTSSQNNEVLPSAAKKFVPLSNAVQVLALHRPSVREQIMQALLESASRMQTDEELEGKSTDEGGVSPNKLRVIQNLRTILLDFLKEKWRVLLKDWRTKVHEALCLIGAKSHADRALSQLDERDAKLEKRKLRELERDLERKRRREEEEEARLRRSRTFVEAVDAEEMRRQHAYPPKRNMWSWDMIQGLKDLFSGQIADLVVKNMDFLPPPPPPSSAEAKIRTFAQFVEYIDREASAQQSSELSSGPAQFASKLTVSDAVAPRRLALERMLEQHAALAASSHLKIFTMEEFRTPSQSDALLARVACDFVHRNEDEAELDLRPTLIRYIAEDLQGRLGLALSTFYHLFAYAEGQYDQYDGLVALFLDEFLSKQLEKEAESLSAGYTDFRINKSLPTFLAGLPRLPLDMLALLAQFCQSPSRLNAGLAALRELIKSRANVRQRCLEFLLYFSVNDQGEIRNKSIICIAKYVYGGLDTKWREFVDKFALDMLKSLLHEEGEAGAEGTGTPPDVGVGKVIEDAKVALLARQQGEGGALQRVVRPKQTVDSEADAMQVDESGAAKIGNQPQAEDKEEGDFDQDFAEEEGGAGEQKLQADEVDEENEEKQDVNLGQLQKELQRRTTLYVRLCTDNPALLAGYMETYAATSRPEMQNLLEIQIKPLIMRLGKLNGPAQTLGLFQSFPSGAESLLVFVLTQLASDREGMSDTLERRKDLVAQAKAIEDRDGTFLFEADDLFVIPILGSLNRSEVKMYLVRILGMDATHVTAAINSILISAKFARVQDDDDAGDNVDEEERLRKIEEQPFLPHDLLVLLTTMPDSEDYTTNDLKNATEVCLTRTAIFTKDVLTRAIGEMLSRSESGEEPLPTLFMRIMIRSVEQQPQIKEYIADVLQELCEREIWTLGDQVLWEGFVVCALKVGTKAFPMLLRLPLPQLESAVQLFKGSALATLVYFAEKNQKSLNLSPDVITVLKSGSTKTTAEAEEPPAKRARTGST